MDFNPRSPHGERRAYARAAAFRRAISTHAPRTGSDFPVGRCKRGNLHFNPRSPHGERREYQFEHTWLGLFQPTLPARGATDWAGRDGLHAVISTHAPRTGSDRYLRRVRYAVGISTHAPRTGSDVAEITIQNYESDFNPRSPHGERPLNKPSLMHVSFHFNPRSPHGERRVVAMRKEYYQGISTHAPRTGSDASTSASPMTASISTHAPRTGSDGRAVFVWAAALDYFNPRSPHGERHRDCKRVCGVRDISTHAPRTGSDRATAALLQRAAKFQPTLPARGATCLVSRIASSAFSNFNPRSPHGERRASTSSSTHGWAYFNPRSPHGERHVNERAAAGRGVVFQPTLPARGATTSKHRKSSLTSYFNPRSPHGERPLLPVWRISG